MNKLNGWNDLYLGHPSYAPSTGSKVCLRAKLSQFSFVANSPNFVSKPPCSTLAMVSKSFSMQVWLHWDFFSLWHMVVVGSGGSAFCVEGWGGWRWLFLLAWWRFLLWVFQQEFCDVVLWWYSIFLIRPAHCALVGGLAVGVLIGFGSGPVQGGGGGGSLLVAFPSRFSSLVRLFSLTS